MDFSYGLILIVVAIGLVQLIAGIIIGRAVPLRGLRSGSLDAWSLHRMTREERDLHGVLVAGSDHLTSYNLYAEAYERCGYMGEVYGLPRHLFGEEIESWAEHRGVLVKSIEDAALGMASVYRAIGLQLPSRMPMARVTTWRI